MYLILYGNLKIRECKGLNSRGPSTIFYLYVKKNKNSK